MPCGRGEWQTPISKTIYLLFLSWKNHPQQCQYPRFLLHGKVQSFAACRHLLSSFSPYPGSLACSPLLSPSGSILDPVCGAARPAPREPTCKCIALWERERGKERGSRLEAVGHLAHRKNRWVYHASAGHKFLCSPGITLAWVWNRPSALSKW